MSEGVRRLSLLLGMLGACASVLAGFSLGIAFAIVGFVLTWGLVPVIGGFCGWVNEGFALDRRGKPARDWRYQHSLIASASGPASLLDLALSELDLSRIDSLAYRYILALGNTVAMLFAVGWGGLLLFRAVPTLFFRVEQFREPLARLGLTHQPMQSLADWLQGFGIDIRSVAVPIRFEIGGMSISFFPGVSFIDLPYGLYLSPLAFCAVVGLFCTLMWLHTRVGEETTAVRCNEARLILLSRLQSKELERRARQLLSSPSELEEWAQGLAEIWPPKLIATALEEGVLSSANALLILRNSPDAWDQRGDAVVQVFRHLDREDKREALRYVDGRQFAELAWDHPDSDLFSFAAGVARGFEDQGERASALAVLLPRLSPEDRQPLFEEAKKAARGISDTEPLARLIPWAPEAERADLIDEVLARSPISVGRVGPSNLGFTPDSTLAYFHLFKHARDDTQRQEITTWLSDAVWHARANFFYDELPDEPSPLRDILSRLGPLLSEPAMAHVLTKVASYQERPESEFQDERLHGSRVVIALAPHIPEPLLGKALELARSVQDPTAKAKTLTALACQLPQPDRERVLREAIDPVLAKVTEVGFRTEVGIRISFLKLMTLAAPHLGADSWRDIFGQVREEPRNHLLALCAAVQCVTLPNALPGGRDKLLREAVRMVRKGSDDLRYESRELYNSFFPALELLVPHLDDKQIDQILEGAPLKVTSSNEFHRSKVLVRWVFVLPPHKRDRIWQALRENSPGTWASGEWLWVGKNLENRTPGDLLALMPDDVREDALRIAIWKGASDWLSDGNSDRSLIVDAAPYLKPEVLSGLLALSLQMLIDKHGST